MDKYLNFEQLKRVEPHSFVIYKRQGFSGVAVIAPHGGGIEPGTSEIARGIAGVEHSLYSFEGRKRTRNKDLHLTSTNFDEPTGVKITNQSERVLAIHGCSGRKPVVYLGGLDAELKNKIRECLIEVGFKAEEHSDPDLQGISPDNICNRSKNNCGVQLEISYGLRKLMFENVDKREGRTRTKSYFDKFIFAVRKAIVNTESTKS
jgi:phage replication-related protein YjqB (UPF0714/DUF867 family)